MKYLLNTLFILLISGHFLFGNNPNPNYTKNFVMGEIQLKSISALTFGPQGILFLGDPMNAAVYALDTKDSSPMAAAESFEVKNIDKKIASFLGSDLEGISIKDMVVNPISKNVYLSVIRMGAPIILKVDAEGNLSEVTLDNVLHSKIDLENPVSEEAESRGRKLRTWAISDLAFSGEKLFIAGLSNEEFASTFWTIPFPFTEKQTLTNLEIYHAAHGRYETQSPIKTFLPYTIDNEPQILASYTCTPLVTFPVNQLEGGKKLMGKTVAELGNRNTPLDIISYKKDGNPYILIANSNRTLMKIDPNDIASFEKSLDQKVPSSDTDGVKFLSIAQVGIQQLDNFDEENVLVIQRSVNDGSLNLKPISKKRL
ncbi:MAG: hypothetical protein KTR26_18905 [Flammeovirgaceae bacterium]|nr:hypothetical protein [Flammeovirgaceae bacterium]